MIDRRTLLHSLGALPLLTLQPKSAQRGTDPKFGFLGFGPETEAERVATVLEKIVDLGQRYGYQTVPLNAARVGQMSMDDLSGFIVYGAGVEALSDPVPSERASGVEPGFSTARLNDKSLRLLAKNVKRGAGLLAIHGAAGISPSRGVRARNQARRSRWVSLLGGESMGARASQNGRVRMADRSVPGMRQLDSGFEASERWLTFKNFDPQMHVVMVQETAGLGGEIYQRSPYPLTWLRYHGKGRVFYTGLGYSLQGWKTDVLRRTIVGGALWVLRDTEADVSSNLMRVTPQAIQAEYPI